MKAINTDNAKQACRDKPEGSERLGCHSSVAPGKACTVLCSACETGDVGSGCHGCLDLQR